MSTERMLVLGGSRGIGAACAEHLAAKGCDLWCVSRGPSAHGRWIEADLSCPDGISEVVQSVGDAPLDALLYLGGIWETGAFTDAYSFEDSPYAETQAVLAVNLVAPIELVKALLPSLRRSDNPRAVFIGSLSGLENSATREVANTASKFGLRGAAEAMRAACTGQGISFSVINPGNLATPEVLKDIETGSFAPQTPIPMSDLLTALDCVLGMSPASEIRVLDLAQRMPG